MEKFKKKGGEITCQIDTLRINQIIKGIDGKDSLIYVDSLVPIYTTNIVTRWKTRFDNKRFKDSLVVISKMYRDSLRYGVKTSKIVAKKEVKVNRIEHRGTISWWRWLLLGIFLGLLLRFIFSVAKMFLTR